MVPRDLGGRGSPEGPGAMGPASSGPPLAGVGAVGFGQSPAGS